MNNILLKAEGVSKAYTGHKALDNVTIEVPRGSVYGLLGPNGAGKTTLIRIINHITAPDSGTVYFDGHQLTAADVSRIGYLPEERGLYKKMKVGEQATFFARLKGLSSRDADRAVRSWFERLEIGNWWDKKVEELSKGMAQKVQLVITVLHRPELLIFDEPFSGFDPINAAVLKREILQLRNEGATVIFSTHNMGSVEELCDSITLINRSRNILSGRVDEIRRQYGGNRWELSYEGDSESLRNAITPMAVIADVPPGAPGELKTLIIDLRDGADLQSLIAIANETVMLRGFNAKLPSMDNIFIEAVQQSADHN